MKDIISAGKLLTNLPHDSDFIKLFLWVQYYDTLSSFSLVHWRRYAAVGDAYVKDIDESLVRVRTRTCYRLKVFMSETSAHYSTNSQNFRCPTESHCPMRSLAHYFKVSTQFKMHFTRTKPRRSSSVPNLTPSGTP